MRRGKSPNLRNDDANRRYLASHIPEQWLHSDGSVASLRGRRRLTISTQPKLPFARYRVMNSGGTMDKSTWGYCRGYTYALLQ